MPRVAYLVLVFMACGPTKVNTGGPTCQQIQDGVFKARWILEQPKASTACPLHSGGVDPFVIKNGSLEPPITGTDCQTFQMDCAVQIICTFVQPQINYRLAAQMWKLALMHSINKGHNETIIDNSGIS